MPFGAVSVQGVVQLSLPKVTSAPAGTDVTCTGVPGALGPLKLGILTLGKSKLGMLESAPQAESSLPFRSAGCCNRRFIRPLTLSSER